MKILCACLNSKLLRFHGIQNFANSDTENAELASKMLRQQHFLYQRKNLYIPILGRIFSSEPDSEDTSRESALPPEFFVPVHRTLLEECGNQ